MNKLAFLLYGMITFAGACFATEMTLAITIDDFPFISGNGQQIREVHHQLTEALLKHKAPAIFFVIANRLNKAQNGELLSLKQQGFDVGNHTYSHLNLRHTPVDEYIEDIDKADQILTPFLTHPKYFRYPYLAQGKWWWIRRKVHDHLASHNMVIAPVTVDSRDFEFNFRMLQHKEADPSFLQTLKKEYLDFVWAQALKAKQANHPLILLIHANQLNSYFLDSLLQMFESHGIHFVKLNSVLGRS